MTEPYFGYNKDYAYQITDYPITGKYLRYDSVETIPGTGKRSDGVVVLSISDLKNR